MVSKRKNPPGFRARGLANHGVEVGHMLKYVTAVGDLEVVVRYRQPLAESHPIVHVETVGGGVASCRLDRHCGRINPDHPESEAGKLFGQKAAPATDVKGTQISKIGTKLVRQDLTEVRQTSWCDAPVKNVQWVVFLPPSLAFAVIHLVVNRHSRPPAATLGEDS